jgi:hypothetical protein
MNAMRRGLSVLRAALVVVLGLCMWNAGTAKAANIEYLMVTRWLHVGGEDKFTSPIDNT